MKTFPLALVLVLASAPLVSGHHSFAAHYFEEQSVTVQGTLVEFELAAGHLGHGRTHEPGGEVNNMRAEIGEEDFRPPSALG